MGQRESWGLVERKRGRRGKETRARDDPRVCESMPGFNDQQRGRGCILAAVEERKERAAAAAAAMEADERARERRRRKKRERGRER